MRGRGLVLRRPGGDPPVLDGVDVDVRAGEALAVTGPSGSGKSTLALVVGGLLRPDAGRVEPADRPGTPLHRLRAAQLARRVGSVLQDPEHQFLTARVDTELAVGPRRTGAAPDEVRRRVADLLERLGLDRLAGANPFTLSGGEKRRLSVATALASAPGALVLDEPTSGQDARTWAELLDLCAGLRDEGRGLLVVTHDEPFADALADRRLVLPPTPVGAAP